MTREELDFIGSMNMHDEISNEAYKKIACHFEGQEPKTDGDCISREDLLKKCVYAPIAPVIKGDSVHYEDVVFARDIINAEPIQQETKADGDCISRDMALEKMADYVASGYADSVEDFEEYSKIICQLPSVQPVPKTGHWERHYSRPNVYVDLFWHCSKCGYKNSNNYANMYHHYCPNCGAKMESEG